jgi:hypothetical protein
MVVVGSVRFFTHVKYCENGTLKESTHVLSPDRSSIHYIVLRTWKIAFSDTPAEKLENF